MMRTAAGLVALALASCTARPTPEKPLIHATKAFDALYGELPSMTVPGPCYATVVYFPSAEAPGRFAPVPIFSMEQGKEEKIAVRTAIRGVAAKGLRIGVTSPFPAGSELESITYVNGVATIRVGGAFRAAAFPAAQGERAAGALAMTVAQFGRGDSVDLTDPAGAVRFRARAVQAQALDPGTPRALGLLAIKELKDRPPEVLSLLFDRPVLVETADFFAPAGTAPLSGKVYSTGFGLAVELHPEPRIPLDPDAKYRVRFSVRDGKGRRAAGEREWVPQTVTRE